MAGHRSRPPSDSRPIASIGWSLVTAAFVIGLVSYTVAGRMRVPPLVVVVSAVVPMLPGISIYRGLALLGEGGSMASEGLLAMATAASVAIAISSSFQRRPR